MWPFLQRKKYDWKKEHARLWKDLVPASGQASSLQGELVRIAGKLTDQAFRNGNMNWDADHERMWRFIADRITRDATFSFFVKRDIRSRVEEIIRNHEAPDLSGDGCAYYFVSEKVVDWCMANTEIMAHDADEHLNR